jgi:hypothetical protein
VGGSVNQLLIRFDVRLHKDDYVAAFWDEERRDQFLLRPEIEWPLSADPLVWPSVFFSKIFRDATSLPYGSIEVDPAIDDGNYWLNLEQMKTHYETHKVPNTNGIVVAIQLFSEKAPTDGVISYSIHDGIQCGLIVEDTTPSECPVGSELLGYDVADASWISGLANCGYDPDEKKQLVRSWAPRLNSFGLLETLDHAVEFRQLCDKRVPEHAPFWVYGITRLPAP